MSFCPTTSKRRQAADWYARRASQMTSGACAVMFNLWAERVRNGDADHRLDTMLANQAEFDAEFPELAKAA
jgi:ferric-dicitrate binding protein FerR (iron transport regulator)